MSDANWYGVLIFVVGYWAGREGFFDDLWTKAASVGGSDE